jgi:riboflavin transporter FmnP
VQKLNTKAIALIIVFAALSIALNPIGIPAVFLTGFYFRFWEIPIVIAFLLLGLKSGVVVAVLRTLAEMTLFPSPAIFIAPPIAFLSTLGMLLGLHFAGRLLKNKTSQSKNPGKNPVVYYTALGTLVRLSFSPFLTYFLYRFLLPTVGIRMPEPAIMGLIPLVLAFGLVLSLYTIPIGYLIARVVSRNLKVGNPL